MKKGLIKMSSISNLERIARVLKLQNVKEEDNKLCLHIQDEINVLLGKVQRLEFMNKMLKNKLVEQPKEVVKYDNDTLKYIEENKRLKALNVELNLAIEGLKRENERYAQERINRIVDNREYIHIDNDLKKFLV